MWYFGILLCNMVVTSGSEQTHTAFTPFNQEELCYLYWDFITQIDIESSHFVTVVRMKPLLIWQNLFKRMIALGNFQIPGSVTTSFRDPLAIAIGWRSYDQNRQPRQETMLLERSGSFSQCQKELRWR